MSGYQPRHLAPPAGPRHLLPRRRRRPLPVVLAACAFAGGGAFAATRTAADPTPTEAVPASSTTTSSTSTSVLTTTTAPPRAATLVFGGDVLIHSPLWAAASVPPGFDFGPMLAPIAPQVQAADVAICHLEVTLARGGEALSSYPRFRAPPELAHDLADAGFDGCSVSSNHALDFGESGVAATLDGMDAAGLDHVGTARSPDEDGRPARYDANGIAVAQLSYAYGFNGFTRPAGKEWLADLVDPTLILADARAARASGAELVVVSLHWGAEYDHDVTAEQQAVAEALAAEPGAIDLVVGHHAHVVQPVSKVGDLWVVWGMGNLLSGNAPRCCLAEATDGVLVSVRVADQPDGSVGVAGISVTPTWNERHTYTVLPAAATLAAGGAPGATAEELRASFERTMSYVLALGGADLGVSADPPLPG